MALNVTTEPLENRQLSMTIEVDEARIDQEMRKAARKVARLVNIPGFRKGRVPFHILVQFVGREAIIEEFIDDLSQELYKEAIEQEGLEPYAIASLDNMEIEQSPVRLHLTVPLQPEIKLGDYRSLRIEEEAPEVDEEEVQERIDGILEGYAGYEEVDRPSQFGDLMTVDVRGVVLDEDGNETETVVFDEEDWDVTPDEENPMEPEGFDQALLGLSPGAEKTFEIVWPEDSPSMYAGETVRFSVKVHEIQAYQMPELTDEIAQSVGPNYETADDLLADIRQTVLEESKEQAQADYLERVLEALVEMSELDYPPAAVELQIDQLVRANDTQLRQMGLEGLSQYLELINQSIEQYREGLREQAERYLRRNLVLAEIAEQENLAVSDEEFEEYIESMAGPLPEDTDEEARQSRESFLEMMRADYSRPYVNDQIMSEKSIDRVLAIARGEEIPEPEAEVESAESAKAEAQKDDSATAAEASTPGDAEETSEAETVPGS